MNYNELSMEMHKRLRGKLEIKSLVKLETTDDLSVAYTPGVSAPCLAIQKDLSLSYELTRRWNTVAVITDGTAVLGLGDIGPEAGMPVMEGKCVLFKEFAGIDAIPLCLRTKDVDVIASTIALLAGSFGAVNLEDISAPRCFEIERKLKQMCEIPIFHDDQHGTAVVTCAGLINALKLIGKKIEEISIVISGAGAAGVAIAKFLLAYGAKNIIMTNSKGIIHRDGNYQSDILSELSKITNLENKKGTLSEAVEGSDVFIGVSAPDILTAGDVKRMAKDPIIFAMANPIPEINPNLAKSAGASIIATGRSDYPNQINNVLAFPGILRGALDSRASDITDKMKLAAAQAISGLIPQEELRPDYIIPSPLDRRVVKAVASAVAQAAAQMEN